jgi:Penicillin amidase
MKAYILPTVLVGLLVAAHGRAADEGFTQLKVDGEKVIIYRDEYDVPQVFAETNKALFTGCGYVVAEDRLWQLELFRRAAQGRLAELLGEKTLATNLQIVGPPPLNVLTALDADVDIRTRHYTAAELQQQLALLDAEEMEICNGGLWRSTTASPPAPFRTTT